MAEKVGDDGTKLIDGPFVVAELLLLSLHVASQVLDLTSAIVSSHRQKVAVDLLLFAQLLHHLRDIRRASDELDKTLATNRATINVL